MTHAIGGVDSRSPDVAARGVSVDVAAADTDAAGAATDDCGGLVVQIDEVDVDDCDR